MSLRNDLQNVQTTLNDVKNNKVTRFAYDQTAYSNNSVASPQSYSWSQHNNIPSNSLSDMKITEAQQNKGFRVKYPVLPKMFFDHFSGRVSYNLNKVSDFMYNFISSVVSSLGTSNGLATLDENRRIPASQASETLMKYKGTWNASTNTPHLQNGVGTKGDVYFCSVAGTVDFGSGSITFKAGERVLYDGSVWQRIPIDSIESVCDIRMSPDFNINLSQQTDISKVLNEKVLRVLFWWQ